MTEVSEYIRAVDVEITNRCNALCTFCPRDKMPKLGSMSSGTFDQVLSRLIEYRADTRLFFAGFGEPLLHPEIADFVGRAKSKGIFTGINTNGALLNESLSHRLLSLGLDVMTFNVASFDENYEELYNLDFDVTLKNVESFISMNESMGSKCDIWGYIVKNDLNESSINEVKKFWKKVGIKNFMLSEETNRGGALNTAECLSFSGAELFKEKAKNYFDSHGIETRCAVPFASIFISFEGDYYLCCQDWQKKAPLGSIGDLSIRDVDDLKLSMLSCDNKVCAACSVDPVNMLANAFFKMDCGDITAEQFDETVSDIRRNYRPFSFDEFK